MRGAKKQVTFNKSPGPTHKYLAMQPNPLPLHPENSRKQLPTRQNVL